MKSQLLTSSIPDKDFFWSIGDILCTSGASVLLLLLTFAGCHFSFDESHSFPLPLHIRFIDFCGPDFQVRFCPVSTAVLGVLCPSKW